MSDLAAWHGTPSGYRYHRCRCDDCKETQRRNAETRRRAQGKPPRNPPRLWIGPLWIDWSGVTAVVICTTCGEQYGPYLDLEDGALVAIAHRSAGHR